MKTVLLALLGVVLGCSGGGRPVDLSGNWPPMERKSDYEDTTEAWTRMARLNEPPLSRRQILEVVATFKSPAWRAAYTDFMTSRALLPADVRQNLLERMKKEDSKFYEVELLVAVDDRRANNLHLGAKSAWRVALVDDAGNEIEAASITRDRRPRSVIAEEFPHLTSFHTPYLAKFPRSAPLFRPDARRVELKIGNQRGAVLLVWNGSNH